MCVFVQGKEIHTVATHKEKNVLRRQARAVVLVDESVRLAFSILLAQWAVVLSSTII